MSRLIFFLLPFSLLSAATDSWYPIDDETLKELRIEKGSWDLISFEHMQRLMEIAGDPVKAEETPSCLSDAVEIATLISSDGIKTTRVYAKEEDFPKEILLDKEVHLDLLSLLYPVSLKKLISDAKAQGVKIHLNLTPLSMIDRYKEEVSELVQSGIDVLHCSQQEAYALTGLDPELASMRLREWAPCVVISMGDKGCWINSAFTLPETLEPSEASARSRGQKSLSAESGETARLPER